MPKRMALPWWSIIAIGLIVLAAILFSIFLVRRLVFGRGGCFLDPSVEVSDLIVAHTKATWTETFQTDPPDVRVTRLSLVERRAVCLIFEAELEITPPDGEARTDELEFRVETKNGKPVAIAAE